MSVVGKGVQWAKKCRWQESSIGKNVQIVRKSVGKTVQLERKCCWQNCAKECVWRKSSVDKLFQLAK